MLAGLGNIDRCMDASFRICLAAYHSVMVSGDQQNTVFNALSVGKYHYTKVLIRSIYFQYLNRRSRQYACKYSTDA